ncbi:MAG: polysaccharide deacetylase family protein [Firmicutes bacterium]|nr:polysaccharide deacetylase family protein [Bacillota bacterium]
MSKYLIINADDFGSFLGANTATFELLERGCITSSTIMMPCMWARQACHWAAEHPQYAIGVHLTTTSEWGKCKWAPVAHEGTESLRDEEGYMWAESDLFEEHADIDEARRECLAQLALAKKLGLNPSHWDNHMGSLYGIATGRMELLEMILELSAEVGLPFRFPQLGVAGQEENRTLDIALPREVLEMLFGQVQQFIQARGVVCPDYLIPHDYNKDNSRDYEQFRDYMFSWVELFPHGVTETYIHPSAENGEVLAASHAGIHRVWEYNLYKDPKFQQHLADCGIKKISYRDLAAMRG